jgi:hypothetical protein
MAITQKNAATDANATDSSVHLKKKKEEEDKAALAAADTSIGTATDAAPADAAAEGTDVRTGTEEVLGTDPTAAARPKLSLYGDREEAPAEKKPMSMGLGLDTPPVTSSFGMVPPTVASFAIAAVLPGGNPEASSSREMVVDSDIVERQSDLMQQRNINPEAQAGEIAKAMREVKARTLGEIYGSKKFWGDDYVANEGPFTDQLNTAFVRAEDQQFQLLMDTDNPHLTWDEKMTRETSWIPWVAEHFDGIARTVLQSTPGGLAAAELMGLEKGDLAIDQDFYQLKSLRDLARYIDPVSYDNTMEVDWTKLWVEAVENGRVSPQFTAAMEDQYGPDWKMRISAFALKEIGVDAFLFTLGNVIPGLGPIMFASRQTSRARRALAIATRIGIIGVGGATIEELLGDVRGEDVNFLRATVERGAGQGVGEGLIPLVKGGLLAGRGIYRTMFDTAEKIAATYW